MDGFYVKQFNEIDLYGHQLISSLLMTIAHPSSASVLPTGWTSAPAT